MSIKEAQEDMRESYFGGGPGMIVSGLVWLAAGVAALVSPKQISVLIFFLGGMFIHPLGVLLSKGLKRSGKHKKDNPLAFLAMESTVLLFIGLFIAYSIVQIRPNWFFPVMLLIIGGRYVIFSSIYGMRIYWVLGLALSISGIAIFLVDETFYLGALVGGTIEMVFAFLVFNLEKSRGESNLNLPTEI